MVQRYLVDMDERGVIRYKGSNIITEFIEWLTAQNTVCLPISGAVPCGETQTQEELNDKHIYVEFKSGQKTFVFPDAFMKGFLKI